MFTMMSRMPFLTMREGGTFAPGLDTSRVNQRLQPHASSGRDNTNFIHETQSSFVCTWAGRDVFFPFLHSAVPKFDTSQEVLGEGMSHSHVVVHPHHVVTGLHSKLLRLVFFRVLTAKARRFRPSSCILSTLVWEEQKSPYSQQRSKFGKNFSDIDAMKGEVLREFEAIDHPLQ
mmetsp:Transcript_37086/g.50191  ORF Transcript_37086/g.50191 Transcript_37086/m.50191 type:complete len:174 (-) Transcript_37086:490-1011(-)